MSGGKGHTDAAVHINVEGGDAVDDAVIQSVEKARKVLVESHDEVYYPTVTVVREAVVQAQAQDCLEVKTDKTVLFDKSDETSRHESNIKRLGETALVSHEEVKAEEVPEAPMMKVINNDVSSRRKRGGVRRVLSGIAIGCCTTTMPVLQDKAFICFLYFSMLSLY